MLHISLAALLAGACLRQPPELSPAADAARQPATAAQPATSASAGHGPAPAGPHQGGDHGPRLGSGHGQGAGLLCAAPFDEAVLQELVGRADQPPRRRCFPEDPLRSFATHDIGQLIERIEQLFDAGDFEGALACAEEASRDYPRLVEPHHDRAAALTALGRLDEARSAFERALALDPEDAETLLGIGDLYVNRLGPDQELSSIGLEYARRGVARARRRGQRGLTCRLVLLEGQALNNLGRPGEAMPRLREACACRPREPEVLYELGLAHFELSQFVAARRAFEDALAQAPDDAYAHYHLALVLEQQHEHLRAEEQFAVARRLAPEEFPATVGLPRREFDSEVATALTELSEAQRRDLAAVQLELEDLPSPTDLLAQSPPLSPTVLGLFRGPPLGVCGLDAPRSIVLYRRNLARTARSREELRAQIRVTMLHEIGHLRGEDEDDLRRRGLE